MVELTEHDSETDRETRRTAPKLAVSSFLSVPIGVSRPVNWGEIQIAFRKAPPSIAESERVRLLIALANGEKLYHEEWRLLTGRNSAADGDAPIGVPYDIGLALITIIQIFLSGSKQARDVLSQRIEQLVASPCVLISASVDQKVISRGPWGALIYALWLLVDPQRPFRARLCNCQYSKCRRFFMKPPKKGPGRQRTRYCSPQHGEAGDAERSPVRMKKARRRNR
jgi:hypothetical protein